MRIRVIEIDGTIISKEDIERMDKQQISMVCSFLDKESDLRFVQQHCNENYSHIVDNILFKL